MFGNDSWAWIIILLLFSWGRNGFGGYGGGYGNSCGTPCATQADVRSAVDQQTLISKIDQQNTKRRLTSSLLCTSIKQNIIPITWKNYVLKYLIFAVPSMQVRKMSKKDRYLMLCLTNLIKGDKIILSLM